MKKFSMVALTAVLASPVLASPIDGTWKIDTKSAQMPTKPMTYLISNGTYHCSCTPPITIAADGKFHPVTGHPYYDEMAVTVVDPHTIKTMTRKGDKTMTEATRTVSADGKMETAEFIDKTGSNGVAVTGKTVLKRVGPAPAGAHATSGDWVETNATQVSDSGTSMTLATKGEVISFKAPTGATFSAKLNGPKAPVTGDAGWTGVELKGTPTAIVETDYLGSKVVGVETMTLLASGKKMSVKMENKIQGTTSVFTATKQ